MARNIAKRFATMTLLYWKPVLTGSGMDYEVPVEFKGFYIGNAQFGDGGVSDMVFSGGSERKNLVLFYGCEPEPNGYVSWKTTLSALDAEGLMGLHPSEIAETHIIKEVTTLTMLKSKASTLANTAWIVNVQ